ncbi:MAG: DUF1559 domain-containing protein [Pirellulaceae bacterium]|nr:DUF1559 domain-containing protein [Pirellulaceae bacterium]
MTLRFRRRAFTLVELLVVIAIIGILVALLLPAIQAAREAARRTQCSNNLKQMGIGLHNYHDTHRVFPPSCVKEKVQDGGGSAQATLWSGLILPFIEQGALWDQVTGMGFAIVWNDDGVNEEVARTRIPAYHCPSTIEFREMFDDGGVNPRYRASYGVVTSGTVGIDLTPFGVNVNRSGQNNNHMDDGPNDGRWDAAFTMQNTTRTMAEIVDGTSNTIFVGERARWMIGQRNYVYTATPNAQNMHSKFSGSTGIEINSKDTGHRGWAGFHSTHPGGAQFLFGDGATRFVSENVNGYLFSCLGTRAGGEAVNLP